ncbi:glycosyltransferase [Chitinophagaceae bacterium LB-8]|uniref:Glycosyltransferase n=1 Tax=Paraflavisolibacter caeni TaxID=2982496 RepID=A0A9X3BJA6_9BACT|nr:glycosyltransferase [Paraflavisolibacter caeni]MCU7550928.1 glycosyltransferase [Paraflavisolibacter caeni]
MLLLTLCFLLFYSALIGYYYYHWKKLKAYEAPANPPSVSVSVIVAARNEEQCIGRLIESLLHQTYPKDLFEIIIVNDFSTDATANVVGSFSNKQVRLVHPDTQPDQSSKKKAIEAGINASKGELVLITDADCLPQKCWIQTIASFYKEKGAVFMAAPVKFLGQRSVLHIFQSLDFMMLQGITAASVQAGTHSMCNGANLAYQRQAFFDVRGFEGIDKIASGDDMLLMYKIWKQHPAKVMYIKSRDVIMQTEPMSSWKAFFGQRIRWSSKATYYDDYRITMVLLFVYLFNLLFLVLLGATFFNISNGWMLLLYLLMKTLVEGIFLYAVSRFYKEERLMLYFPLMQPLHILYTIVIGFISQFGHYEWKGRRTK